jgi:hypothetical protein
MPATMATVHLFLLSDATGEPCVFLVEREPGVVEFPLILLTPSEAEDEAALIAKIESCTGLRVSLRGYVDPPAGTTIYPPESRFLLARLVHGRPEIATPHVGWEWRPATSLFSLQFVPKLMVDELRSYMNG